MGSQNVPGNMYAYRESRVSHFRFCTGGPVMLMPPPLALKCGRSPSMRQWALLSFLGGQDASLSPVHIINVSLDSYPLLW